MSYLKKSRLSHKICPHCDRELNIRTYKEHKRLYFHEESNSWYKTGVQNITSDSDSSDITPPPSPPAVSNQSNSPAAPHLCELDEFEEASMDDLQPPVTPPCETRVVYGVGPG